MSPHSKKTKQKWPDSLLIVRHGQSAGNVARDAAEGAGLSNIDIDDRDVDVPLSPLGERQATALGEWLATLPKNRAPAVVIASPYARAFETAEIAVRAAGKGFEKIRIIHDERLREREFGMLDRLTKAGIIARYPEQNAARQRLGKFYYRPSGGESWCDVLLRLRSFLDMLTRDYPRRRVMVVCHSVVVLCFRYLLERMSEKEILGIDRQNEIANCSVTSYRFDPSKGKHGKLLLERFNYSEPVAKAGERITKESDVASN